MMTDDHIPRCRKFVDAIHFHGTKISFSLGHQESILACAIRHRPSLGGKRKKVAVITRNRIGKGLFHSTKLIFQEYPLKNNVHLLPRCTPKSITVEGINCGWDSGEAQEKDPSSFS
jgi:hypothetical protein